MAAPTSAKAARALRPAPAERVSTADSPGPAGCRRGPGQLERRWPRVSGRCQWPGLPAVNGGVIYVCPICGGATVGRWTERREPMREWRADIEQRLRGAGLDGATEQDIVEELAQHLQDRYEELRRGGIEPEVARAQALAELDDDEPLGQRVGRIIRARPEPLPLGRAPAGVVFGGWLSDLRFGARMLARAPLYAAIAVLVIAFGIGANTVIFTGINTVLLRPP